ILSTPEINANPEIKAYPNPVTDFLTISMNTISQVQYKILNAVGKTVLSGILNESVQQINMSGLPQGIYFISLDINGMQEVKKIIK
ncbi:MAG: T9SS type A sorting domain-containing protein, partial [Bacteroidales bacterium]|nr:T9SS type A sorting domain-containing protein [Bacteroidales bacterium]